MRYSAIIGRLVLGFALSGGVSLTAAAQTRIGTFASGVLPIATGGGNPGSDQYVAIGQAFRAPASAVKLSSLTYWFWTIPGLFDGGGTASLALYAFSGSAPSGSPLYASTFAIPTNPIPLELTAASWLPGIDVTPGALYIALLTGNNPVDQTAVLNDIADSPDNTTGGAEWICAVPAGTCDLAGMNAGVPLVTTFEATFTTSATSTVPEPQTIALVAGGLLGLMGVTWARRPRQT